MQDKATQEFELEVQLLRSLRHRHVIFFFGGMSTVLVVMAGILLICLAGNHKEQPFLVTEYAEKGSLDRLLQAEPLAWKRRCGFILDAAKVMLSC